MAKLTKNNSKYAIVRTAFHGGGVIAFSNSLENAKRIERKNTISCCCCGCCAVVPITEEAKSDLIDFICCDEYTFGYRDYLEEEMSLYDELAFYNGNNHYSTICK